MSNVKIKICGIQTHEDVLCLNETKPDYAGFVFAPGRHYITPDHANTLISKLVDIQSVGVVVDESIEKVIEIVHTSKIDIIQLHGQESEQYIKELAKHINIPIWKAIRIQREKDVEADVSAFTQFVVFDSFTKGEMGGSGKRFAWELLKGKDLSKIWIAGGVNIDNLSDILQIHPYGVDISSGVESYGQKDAKKIKKLIEEVRAYA